MEVKIADVLVLFWCEYIRRHVLFERGSYCQGNAVRRAT